MCYKQRRLEKGKGYDKKRSGTLHRKDWDRENSEKNRIVISARKRKYYEQNSEDLKTYQRIRRLKAEERHKDDCRQHARRFLIKNLDTKCEMCGSKNTREYKYDDLKIYMECLDCKFKWEEDK